ncbi:hypothetical protein [Leptospira interrogans]|uniref:Uncharacterized protein n=1 Tax=Leptospira interrogans str. 2006001854 TaxID=1001590 RepID=M6G6N9_LEPIR|nr:hypothetical protein [Leptospira interrogans]EMM80440.1 hypothetical protein LEP1GSC037_2160 [Leptospira interrogans str. 2006001854]
MSDKMKIQIQTPNGLETKEGIKVNFISAEEPWSTYTLDDGTKLRVKQNLVQIYRIDGEYDSLGNPMYVTQFIPVLLADPPEGLKKK